jgi:hypothetical protein
LENVIIKFVADTSGLKPAIDQLQLLGKISEADAASFAKINDEQKEFIQNLNKSTTEFGKLNSEVEGLMAEIQAGVIEGFADHLAEVTAETKKSATGFKSMKAELKELKAQIASGNLGEKELRAATKRAGELADAIADANNMVKSFEGNRFERVLTRVAAGARAVAAGMAAAQGAQALFGSENEDFNKALVKVQGSMALLQGTIELTTLLQSDSALITGLMEVKTYGLAAAQRVAGAASTALGVQIAASTAVATAGLSLLLASMAYLIVTMDDARESATKMNKALGDDAGVRKSSNEKLLAMMKDGLDKELLMNKQAHDAELTELNKKFRAKTLSQAAYQDAVRIEDDYFLNLQQQTRDKYAQSEAEKAKAHQERLRQIKKQANDKAYQDQLLQIRDEIASNEILMRETNDVDAKMKYYAEIIRLRKAQIQLDRSLTVNERIYNQQILDDDLRKFQESFNQRSEADLESYTETQEAKLEVTLDWWEKYFEVEDRFNAEQAKKRKEDAQMWTSFAIDQARVVSDTVFTINQNRRNAETEQLLTSLNTQREAELANQNLTDAQRLQIEKRYQEQERRLKQQAFEADRGAAIAQAIINGALAVSKTLAVYGWTPAAAPGIIAASVATAAQIAIIQSTPIPQFADGTEFLVGKGTGRSDSNLAYLSHGERVVPAGINSDYFPALSAIQNRDVEPTFANNILTALANGTFDLAAQFQGKQQQADQGFDYDKLGKVLARNKSSVNIQMDEAGYTKYLIKENSKVEFRNTKLRLKN